MPNPQPATPQQMIQQNAQLRAMLLQSSPPMRKNLGAFTQGGVAGQTTRIKLFNVGITTRILLDITCPVTIAVATGTLSPKAPFNFIQRIKLTDYDGTDRLNITGYQLWVLNCIRKATAYGYNNESQTAVLTTPVVSPLTAGNTSFRFLLELPLAFDPASDLRGALLTQTAVGEAYVTIDWNPTLASGANPNDDAVFNGAATTTVVAQAGTTYTVNAFQEFLLPQSVGGAVPLPALDLMTVYEFAGAMRSTDNLAVGQEKLINYPNVRSVIGVYLNYISNGVMAAAPTSMQKFRILANGNNTLREYLPTDKLFEQRLLLNSDLRNDTYFELHRQLPIQTSQYGNVQFGLTPNAVVNTNYPAAVEFGFESFYTKGSTLPGLSQASG